MDEKLLAAVFEEWARRYRENPTKFMSQVDHLLRGTPKTYGEACAIYFNELLKEIQARG